MAIAANSEPYLDWTGEEQFTVVGLSSNTGNTSSHFTYRVKYIDIDGDKPSRGYPKVHVLQSGTEIAGSPFKMEYVSGDYQNGAIYVYTRQLPAGEEYSYYFEAKDSKGAVAHGLPSTLAFGPRVEKLEEIKIQGGTNVAIAEFIGKNVSQADASIVADFIRTELVNTHMFNVMDRNNMDTVLAEQKFQNSGCTEQECAVEMGKLLNVKKMFVGSLSKLVDSYYITVNVIDVETGKILASYESDASSSRELKDTCRKLIRKIIH